jgi:hypothetical protein
MQFSVRGKVASVAGSNGPAQVTATPVSGSTCGSPSEIAASLTTMTNADLAYSLRVPPGLFVFSARLGASTRWYDHASSCETATPVFVGDDLTLDIN